MVKYRFTSLLILTLLARVSAHAQPTPDLERRVAELQAKVESLELKLSQLLATMQPIAPPPVQAAVPDPPTAVAEGPILTGVSVSGDSRSAPDAATRLPVAGYMDFHINKERGDFFRPDFHRFVLLFGHSFSGRIKFWSELELEHSRVESGEASGEIALEQAYLDFLVKPYFNLRAGMLLTPVGIINERHEPPSFNGVERPFVETFIIPTTWHELGFGLTGDLGHGFRYRAYIMGSLDASRFDAENGISEGRTSGFESSFRNPAKVARVEYAGVRRLTLGASIYSGHAGFKTPGLNPHVSIAEFDGRYGYRRLDFRGLFANTWLSQAGQLNDQLQRQFGSNPNVASQMRGFYLEPAVHVFPRRNRNDLILFTRYERFNTQQEMPAGYLPLAQFDRSAWVTGVTLKPNADVAIKFDYVFNRNASAVVRALDGINLGVGWWF